MTHTQGRLTTGKTLTRIYAADGEEIAVATRASLIHRLHAPETAAELVRRWNAFEPGGAVDAAIEALRWYQDRETGSIARAALAALTEGGQP